MAQGSAAAEIGDLAAQQMSVRELMRLDTALALAQSKDRLRAKGPGEAGGLSGAPLGGGPMLEGEGLKLIAIYGVGKKLLAEVMIGPQAHVYVRGQALAVGAKAGPSAYLLRGISGSCVQLERQDKAQTLCLHPGLWTAK